MKRIVVGGMLLALWATAALAQTSPPPPEQPQLTLPPGLANMPEAKWGASDLPTGLSNERSQRDWDTPTPPGWTNANSQGWQNGGGPTSVGAGHSSMAGGKGKGK